MKPTFTVLAVVLGMLLGGCVTRGPTAAEKQSGDITYSLDEAFRKLRACSDEVDRSPEYQRVSAKFTFGNPPMTMLTDKSKPTEAEAQALMALHKMNAACRAEHLQALDMTHSAFVSVAVTSFAEADRDYAKLVKREISWGGYAELTVARRERLRARWKEAVNEISANLKDAHAKEIAGRQKAARALAAWTDAQRASLPVFTQCAYVTGGLTCTSF